MARSSTISSPSSVGPTIFDDLYEIISPVGRGRNSVVYQARCLNSSGKQSAASLVALKVLVGNAKDPEMHVKRMKREALAMLSCVNRNVIKLLDYRSAGELCYLAMEFAERGDLRQMLEVQHDVFTPDLVLRLMVQVLSGLEKIHSVGIIHRDLKPENLLLTRDCTIKIADFGISCLPSEKIAPEEANRGVGTFDYLAPECLEDGVSNQATDVYSAAVTCYQLLTGHMPFAGLSFTEQIANKMESRIIPLERYIKHTPPMLEELMSQALASDPARRFQTAAEFKQALESFIQGSWRPESVAAARNGERERRASAVSAPTAEIISPFLQLHQGLKDLSWEERPAGGAAPEPEQLDPSGTYLDESNYFLDEAPCGNACSAHFALDRDTAEEPGKWGNEFADNQSSHTRDNLKPDELFLPDADTDDAAAQQALFYPSDVRRGWRKTARLAVVMLITAAVCVALVFYRAIPGLRKTPTQVDVAVRPAEDASHARALFSPPASRELPDKVRALSFAALAERDSNGAISNLFADGEPTGLVGIPLNDGREVMVLLARGGWKPVIIEAEKLKGSKELLLASGGLNLQLVIREEVQQSGARLSGVFKEQNTGREGTWAIW